MIGKELESIASQMNYKSYFEQKENIGQGGYAQVYKVINRMDKNEYAVKIIKIKLRDIRNNLDKELNKITRESRHLASLHHPSIIRYYSSWVEVGKKKNDKDMKKKNSGDYPKASQQWETEEKKQEKTPQKKKEFKAVFESDDEESEQYYSDASGDFQFIVEEDEEQIEEQEKKKQKKAPVSPKKGAKVKQNSQLFPLNTKKEIKELIDSNDNLADKSTSPEQINSKFQDLSELPQLKKDNSTPVKNNYNLEGLEDQDEDLKSQQSQQLQIKKGQSERKQVGVYNQNDSPTRQRRNSLSQLEERQSFEEYEEILFYIQMELCDGTLNQYIEKRNERINKLNGSSQKSLFKQDLEGIESRQEWEKTYDILSQILDGLDYIHNTCKLVHRDLKPHNIFLKGEDNKVKIGDFGLVKKINKFILKNQSGQGNSIFKENFSQIRNKKMSLDIANYCEKETLVINKKDLKTKQKNNWPIHLPKNEINLGNSNTPNQEEENDEFDQFLTKNRGTETYASPEQMNADFEAFDQRADLYSLGIIMIQLLNPISTQMELIQSIREVKSQQKVPKFILTKHPFLSKVLVKCLERDPKNRPTIKEIQEALRKDRFQNQMFMKRKKSNDAQSFSCSLMIENQESKQSHKVIKVLDNEVFFYHEKQDKAEFVYNVKECEIVLEEQLFCITLKHQMMKNVSIFFDNKKDYDKALMLFDENLSLQSISQQIAKQQKVYQMEPQNDNSEWMMQVVEQN